MCNFVTFLSLVRKVRLDMKKYRFNVSEKIFSLDTVLREETLIG